MITHVKLVVLGACVAFVLMGCFAALPVPEIEITGQKTVGGPVVALSDGDTLDLGIADPENTLTITITNVGTADLVLSGGPAFVALTNDPDEPDFDIPVQPDGVIPPNESTNFDVVLAYSGSSEGVRSGSIRVETNDADEDEFVFALTGETVS